MIFFDLDGPILDVSEKYFRVYSDLVNELGGTPLDKEDYWERKRSKQKESQILSDSHLTVAKHSLYHQLRKERIETPDYWKFDRVWPELDEAMRSSRLRGQLVLVTLRNRTEALIEELGALKIRDWFETILSTDGDSTGPDRHTAKVRLVRSTFNDVSEKWFIGDTETDIRAGHALGMKCAAVSFGIRTPEILEKESPNIIFDHPSALASWLSYSNF
jgi:phosphoglycolate phosphatase-like HAD superfamily hydrolase